MFLKKLWVFNKSIALFFILFIIIWLFINYKQGAVASPFFQYGMYSRKFSINDTQRVIQLFVNDKIIDFTNYSMVKRDLLQVSLENYMREKEANLICFYTMKRIMSKVGIGQWMKEEYYTNAVSDEDFTKWYKRLVNKSIGYKIDKLEVFEQKYLWDGSQLIPILYPSKINCIVPY